MYFMKPIFNEDNNSVVKSCKVTISINIYLFVKIEERPTAYVSNRIRAQKNVEGYLNAYINLRKAKLKVGQSDMFMLGLMNY